MNTLNDQYNNVFTNMNSQIQEFDNANLNNRKSSKNLGQTSQKQNKDDLIFIHHLIQKNLNLRNWAVIENNSVFNCFTSLSLYNFLDNLITEKKHI